MIVLCITDIVTPAEIRLHDLYVFPLAVIAYKCTPIWMPISGLTISLSMQLLTFYLQKSSMGEFITDTIVAFGSSVLTVLMATKLSASNLRIAEIENSDSLTGLFNRRYFHSIVNTVINQQVNFGQNFCIVALCLTDFEKINETLGRHTGQEILVQLSKILLENTRPGDYVARLGRDEFSIIRLNEDEEKCGFFCKNIKIEMEKKLMLIGFSVDINIGYTAFDRPPISAATALRIADEAMRKSKIRE